MPYVAFFFVSVNVTMVIVLVAPGNKLCCYRVMGHFFSHGYHGWVWLI